MFFQWLIDYGFGGWIGKEGLGEGRGRKVRVCRMQKLSEREDPSFTTYLVIM